MKCPDCNYYFCNNHLKTHKCKYICQNSTSKSKSKGYLCKKCKKIICIENFFNHIKECYEGKTATSNIQPELESLGNICELLLQLKYDIKQILIYKLSRNDFSNCDTLELHIISIDELYLEIYDSTLALENLKEDLNKEFIKDEYNYFIEKYNKLKSKNINAMSEFDLSSDEDDDVERC